MIIALLFTASVVPAGQSFSYTPTAVWKGDGPVWCSDCRVSDFRELPCERLTGHAAPGRAFRVSVSAPRASMPDPA